VDVSGLLSGLGQIVIGVVVGFVVGVVTNRALERRADLRYRVTTTGDLLPDRELAPIVVTVFDKRVDVLVAVTCTFTNRGNQELEHVPYTWGVGQATRVLSLTVDHADRIQTRGERTGDIVLLNPGENVTLTWLLGDPEDPSFFIEARGPGIIAKPERESAYDPVVEATQFIAGSLIVVFAAASVVYGAVFPTAWVFFLVLLVAAVTYVRLRTRRRLV
jgi:hypothetical protein